MKSYLNEDKVSSLTSLSFESLSDYVCSVQQIDQDCSIKIPKTEIPKYKTESETDVPSHHGMIERKTNIPSHRTETELPNQHDTEILESYDKLRRPELPNHDTELPDFELANRTTKFELNPEAPVFNSLYDSSDFYKYKLVELFERIHKSNVPNYECCRIPIPYNRLNISLWRKVLHDYDDQIICDFLEFGIPLDFDKSVQLHTDERQNHKGARDYQEYVSEYIRRFVSECRIAGPFTNNPFSVPIMVSPLNSVPKSSSIERRIIVMAERGRFGKQRNIQGILSRRTN